MFSRRALCLATALPLCLLAGAAAALAGPAGAPAGPPVAVLAVELSGDAPAELAASLERSLRVGVERAGQHVTAERATARRLLRARVEASGAHYRIELELLGSEGGARQRLRALREDCAVCTINELNALLRRRTRTLLSAPTSAAPATIAPPAQEIATPGAPPSTAMQEDAPTRVGELSEAPSGEATLFFREEPAPALSGRFGRWKWVTGGAAVAALAVGGWLLAADGDPTCAAEPGRQCPEVRNTGLAGMATITAGVGLAVASGWMFYKESQEGRAVAAGAAVSPDGITAALLGRF